MTLLLPETSSGFSDMLDRLSPELLKEIDGMFKTVKGAVIMPRFEASASVELLEILRDMGLPAGGFDSISEDEEYFLSTMRHAVKVKVDEEGTEAAAVTMAGTNSIGTYVSFDHPFIYLIRDTAADAMIFIGAVTKF